MNKSVTKIDKRKKAIETIMELVKNSSHVLIIHYSSESFYDIKDGRTPRVTSIAVRYLKTGQTKSFSIHKIEEIQKVKVDNIEDQYDDLEFSMLSEFFVFLKEHKSYIWIHCNMRNINYVFAAIENRFVV